MYLHISGCAMVLGLVCQRSAILGGVREITVNSGGPTRCCSSQIHHSVLRVSLSAFRLRLSVAASMPT